MRIAFTYGRCDNHIDDFTILGYNKVKFFAIKMLRPKSFQVTPPSKWRYTEQSTGVEFIDVSWDSLIQRIERHRIIHNIPMEDGWKDMIASEMCLNGVVKDCHDPERHEAHLEAIRSVGRSLWKELHEYTEKYPDKPELFQREMAYEWLARWSERVPSFGCDCRNKWKEIIKKLPPDLSCRKAFVKWAIEAHNRVNDWLCKPRFQPPSWLDEP